MTLGKGVSGGYAPVSAVLARDEIIEPIARGSGALVHAQTFSHHAVTCAAAVAALDYVDKHALVARCRSDWRDVPRTSCRHCASCRAWATCAGEGLLAGVEFVADTVTRAPFPRSLKFAEKFVRNAQQEGLIVWPNVGHADGTNGDLVMLAPPFIISEHEIDEIVERFTAALDAHDARPPRPAPTRHEQGRLHAGRDRRARARRRHRGASKGSRTSSASPRRTRSSGSSGATSRSAA